MNKILPYLLFLIKLLTVITSSPRTDENGYYTTMHRLQSFYGSLSSFPAISSCDVIANINYMQIRYINEGNG